MLPNRQISFYFFCLMPLVAILGQPAGIRVRPFGFVDGLSHRDVFKVQQDRAGFLWITTANGLNRFDGHTFVDWTAAYALPALPNDVYPDLVLDANDHIAMSMGRYVVTLLPATNEVDSVKYPAAPEAVLRNLFQDGMGNLWATASSPNDTTSLALVRCSPGSDFQLVARLPGKYPNRPIAQVGNRVFVGASENELWAYDLSGQQVEQFELPAPRREKAYSRVIQLQATADGTLWALLDHGQVYRLPAKSTTFRRHPMGDMPLDNFRPSAFAVGEQGDLWLGGLVTPETGAGDSPCSSIQPGASLLHFNPATGKLRDFNYYLRQAMPFAEPPRQLFLDRTGVLWIASQFDLIQVVESNLFDRYLSDGNECCKDGVCSVRGMAEDSQGNIYIAYYNSIHVLNPRTGSLSPLFSKQLTNPFGLLCHGNSLWTGAGLRIDLRSLNIDTVAQVKGAEGVVALDAEGNIWFGGQQTLAYLPPGSKGVTDFLTEKNKAGDLAKQQVTFLAKAKEGGLWVGTKGAGIFRISKDKGVVAHFEKGSPAGFPHNQVLSLLEMNGRLWAGTPEGIAAIDLLTPHAVKTFTTANGLTNNFINSLLPDGDTVLWASTDNGLAQLNLRTGNISNFFDTDGLAKNEFNRIAALRATDGRLYFGGIAGVTSFLPGPRYGLRHGRQVSRLMLTNFSKFDGENVYNQAWGLSDEQPFELSHREEMFTFWFALADFTDPKLHLFSYRLEGYDREWSKASTVNFARYFNIPAGSYVLHVRASRGGGDWVADELHIPVIIRQAFYKSWWFQALALALATGMVFGVMRYRVRRLQQHEAELEGMVKERTQELAFEKQKSEDLLLNILPAETAEELKRSGATKARRYGHATVLFSDFKDFSIIAAHMQPEALVTELDRCFRGFDEIMELYGLEKIKTVGDAYLCAGALNDEENPADAARRVVLAGLEIQAFLHALALENREAGKPVFEARIGIHSGPVIAGIVGIKKFAYDIWGDTVNIAERLQSSGEVGRVNISKSTHDLVGQHFLYTCRGHIKAKHDQEVEMYFVDGTLEE